MNNEQLQQYVIATGMCQPLTESTVPQQVTWTVDSWTCASKCRNLKIFLHFAKLFCELYPNWRLSPSVSDPFHTIEVANDKKGYRLIDRHPANEILIENVPPDFSDPLPQWRVVNMQEFYGWALGEDPPYWVKE